MALGTVEGTLSNKLTVEETNSKDRSFKNGAISADNRDISRGTAVV